MQRVLWLSYMENLNMDIKKYIKHIKSVYKRLMCLGIAAVMFVFASPAAAGGISAFAAESGGAVEAEIIESTETEFYDAFDYETHWAKEYIDYVLENGYMTCVSQEGVYFEPDVPMTRAVFVESLAKLAGVKFAETKNEIDADPVGDGGVDDTEESGDDAVFEDQAERECGMETGLDGGNDESGSSGASDIYDKNSSEYNEWGIYIDEQQVYEPDLEALAAKFGDMDGTEPYAPAAAWAVENGIINGTGGNFSADGVMNRQTLAVIMHRAADILGIDLEEDWSVVIDYNDLDEVSDWAIEGIAYCKMTGLMQGGSDGCFAPKREITRAEGAAVLVRLIRHMNEKQ